tara:strand:+ start:811 stop:1002 length:192 start_codon:yes stop_codon:yes gene_type:complete
MAEIIFRDNSIQTGHRVKIPKPIIDTLGFEVKQPIVIRFDVDGRKITIEEEKVEKKKTRGVKK